MKTIKVFKSRQQKVIDLLEKTLEFLEEGNKFGVKIDDNLIEKVRIGISDTENEKLKVALIGGFSEGKTSIAAAWAEDYDKSIMKISHSESSDKIECFTIGDIILIDTPGLFGSKENDNFEKYKDITKKYVSEAHIVLYVMNPNNPIKDSHKTDLQWLFKDLNILDRTIFVIGRFDEEVDIEDEDDYLKGLEIKKKNIVGRLRDFDILEDDKNIIIVGVSSDPFQKGLKYWLDNLEEFRKLSHIELLQEATTKKIEASGSKKDLIVSTQKSIVSDVLIRELPIAHERVNKAYMESMQLGELSEDMQVELDKTNKRINNARINLKEYVLDFFTDLILQAKGTSLDTFDEFFQRNIGSEGIILENRIKNEFERQLGGALQEINQLQTSYNTGVNHYQSVLGEMAFKGIKMGGTFLKNGSIKVTNTAILASRDFFKLPIKFKPWGAVKLAKGINNALPIIGDIIGIGFDVWEMYSEKQKQIEFKKVIDDVVKKFEAQRKELLDFVDNHDDFINMFFGSYLDLKSRIDLLKSELELKKKQKEEFVIWRQAGETIEVEFEQL
ncbi:LeoA/HP0731 family dynamin-like GTPase [Acetoanaerobium noterae]|uniref:LeoA/HP0731 family dynamin-like GTPase n=1 Tax=Acetoanaerobium noterae TaxID=745369 RepID=UPI0032213B6B